MKLENKALGTYELAIDNLNQGQLEDFFKRLREKNVDLHNISGPEYQGSCLRVAVDMGWVSPKIDVSAAKPATVRWLATAVQEKIAVILEIPPS
jgi:hypothetical protein